MPYTEQINNLTRSVEELAREGKQRLKLIMVSAGVACIVLCAVIAFAIRTTHQLTQDIQNQRYQACVDQNRHHDNALNYIISLTKQQHQSAALKQREIREYRILFQALAPHQACRVQVHPLGKPKPHKP